MDDYRRQEFSIMYPIWKRNVVLEQTVAALRVKEKRVLFQYMREQGVTCHTFFPQFGMTAGEFASWHIIADSGRRHRGGASNPADAL